MQTLYHNCRLIDGTGAPAVEQGYLLVEDGMIRRVGAIAGFYGKTLDNIIMRIVDVMLSLIHIFTVLW